MYNLSLEDVRDFASRNIGLIDAHGAHSITARVLITEYEIYTEEMTPVGVVTNYAKAVTVPGEPKILMHEWPGERTLSHELGHVAKYVGNGADALHSKDPKNLMYRLSGGSEPDCQWCTKVANLAE